LETRRLYIRPVVPPSPVFVAMLMLIDFASSFRIVARRFYEFQTDF
jgi:hypothetical protein